MKEFFKKLLKKIEHLMFPDDIKCIFCGRDVPDFENQPYCEDCKKVLPLNNQNRCEICAEPIGNEAKVCDYCQKHRRSFKKAYCPFVYEGIVRKAILGYKSSNKRYLAKDFAKFIVNEIQNVKIDYITFVPMTKKKTKERTFNQSKLLANEVAKLLNLPVIDLFSRTMDSQAQKYLSAKERETAVLKLYKLNDVKLDRSKTVLIVDDIITTGATVNALASMIEKRVKAVYVCSIARNKFLKEQKNDENT